MKYHNGFTCDTIASALNLIAVMRRFPKSLIYSCFLFATSPVSSQDKVTPAADPVRSVKVSNSGGKSALTCGLEIPSHAVLARQSHQIADLRRVYQLSGYGVSASVWDFGLPHEFHSELLGQIEYPVDPKTSNNIDKLDDIPVSHHATHVAAIVAGSGGSDSGGIGVAPGLLLNVFDVSQGKNMEKLEKATAYLPQLVVSNHSYNYDIGWTRKGQSSACSIPAHCQNAVKKHDIKACWDEIFCKPEYGSLYCFDSRDCEKNPENCPLKEAIQGIQSLRFIAQNAINSDRNKAPWGFGVYDPYGAQWIDEIAVKQPYHTIVWASGNHRHGKAPEENPWFCDVGLDPLSKEWVSYPRNYLDFPRPSNVIDDSGFDTMAGQALGKNVLTVGAMVDSDETLWEREQRFFVQARGFSALGPTDDGRIKPDVVATGEYFYSASVGNNCRFAPCKKEDIKLLNDVSTCRIADGTSMAAPVVTGIVALLNELSMRLTGEFLKSEKVKTTLIHTALSYEESGEPAYETGWGAVQALEAGKLIAGDAGILLDGQFDSTVTSDVEYAGVRDNRDPVRVTLVYLDKAGPSTSTYDSNFKLTTLTPDADDRTSQLTSNLELELVSPSGSKTCPWKLDPDNPQLRAFKDSAHCTNGVDNVLRIDSPGYDASDGEWKIVVRCKSGCDDPVPFSLAISGLRLKDTSL